MSFYLARVVQVLIELQQQHKKALAGFNIRRVTNLTPV